MTAAPRPGAAPATGALQQPARAGRQEPRDGSVGRQEEEGVMPGARARCAQALPHCPRGCQGRCSPAWVGAPASAALRPRARGCLSAGPWQVQGPSKMHSQQRDGDKGRRGGHGEPFPWQGQEGLILHHILSPALPVCGELQGRQSVSPRAPVRAAPANRPCGQRAGSSLTSASSDVPGTRCGCLVTGTQTDDPLGEQRAALSVGRGRLGRALGQPGQ